MFKPNMFTIIATLAVGVAVLVALYFGAPLVIGWLLIGFLATDLAVRAWRRRGRRL